MKTTLKPGDVLIRVFSESAYEILDATTQQQIAIAPDLHVAVKIASERGGAVWRANIDNRGRPLGDPVLLLPKLTSTLG